LSDPEIIELIKRYERDLDAFSRARQVIVDHAISLESEPEVHRMFIGWSATQIVLHGLVLCISRTQGLIEDLRKNLERHNVVNLMEIKDAR
jgi:hypothetical protein